MSDRRSLADLAVNVLAAVAAMDADVTNEHEERHQIRTIKRLAEQQLEQTLRQVCELTYLAQDIRREAGKKREGGAE